MMTNLLRRPPWWLLAIAAVGSTTASVALVKVLA
jgi:hypothetical protein